MLSEAQVKQFERDGYLHGGQVLTDAQVDTLRDEIQRVIDDDGKAGMPQPVLLRNLNANNPNAPVWQIVNIWEASPSFRDLLIFNPHISEEMSQLTGASQLRIWHDQVQYKPPMYGGTTMWHQDAPLWPIIAPMTEVSAWVALDDVDVDNGCMWMVPGSHRWGNHMSFIREHVPTFDAMPAEFEGRSIEKRPCPVRKGEVHYHHALTWHGSPDNTSARPRRAIAIHYMTDETRYVASGNHPMKPFVEVQDGDVMRGDHFPLVWERGLAPA
jgi:ectoine hydroxylase-related dioxygenase (phytanoyl-CoA dioxygenase family)